jgi:hypothetical protein
MVVSEYRIRDAVYQPGMLPNGKIQLVFRLPQCYGVEHGHLSGCHSQALKHEDWLGGRRVHKSLWKHTTRPWIRRMAIVNNQND